MTESLSLLGFERGRTYTGEGKGGPDPQREFVDLTTNHSLFLISSFDIPNTPPLNYP